MGWILYVLILEYFDIFFFFLVSLCLKYFMLKVKVDLMVNLCINFNYKKNIKFYVFVVLLYVYV